MLQFKKCAVLALGFMVLTQFASAQQTALSLQEAISKGIAASNVMKADEAKRAGADASIIEAKDARLPNFTVSGSALYLPTANVDIKARSNGNGNGSAPSPKSAFYGIANLSLPLYTAGKIKNNIARTQFMANAIENDSKRNKELIEYSIVEAYTNVYVSEKTTDIIRENIKASETRDSSLVSLEKNGIIARNDLLKAQLHTSELILKLAEATSNNAIAKANLNILINQPEDAAVTVAANFSDSLLTIKSYGDVVSSAVNNRGDVLALEQRKLAASSSEKVARAQAYPSIALTGGYVAADIPKVLTITNAVNVGVGIQYNISNLWKKNTQLLQATAVKRELEANEDILKNQIRLNLFKSFQQLQLAVAKEKLYRQSLEQATENYRITKNKFDNSLATVSDLLDADVLVTQAKINIALAATEIYLQNKKYLLQAGNN